MVTFEETGLAGTTSAYRPGRTGDGDAFFEKLPPSLPRVGCKGRTGDGDSEGVTCASSCVLHTASTFVVIVIVFFVNLGTFKAPFA